MSLKRWLLIDAEDSAGESQGGTAELGFRLRRLRGGIREGVELIDIVCGSLRFSIVPTRGMGIWKAHWVNVEFGWQSPIAGPVNPSLVPMFDPSGLGWLDGFDELLARCGLHSNGAPEFDDAGRLKYPLHGRIANIPAQRVEISIDEPQSTIEIRGIVLESRFHFQKLELTTTYRCQLGVPKISIHDEIRNRSANTSTFQLLYHVNLGPPLLDPGAKIVAPIREIAPRDIIAANAIDSWDTCAPPTTDSPEQVFFMRLLADQNHQTSTLLHNSAADIGILLAFDVRQLPCFSLWKNAEGLLDGYVVGLEPATNYPNVRSFEEKRGRVVQLAAEESYEIQVELGFCCGRESVHREIKRIASLQTQAPHRLIWPSPEYSPPNDSESAKA